MSALYGRCCCKSRCTDAIPGRIDLWDCGLKVFIDFDVQLVPPDLTQEREQDRADVQSGHMTNRAYIKKWVLPDGATEEVIDEYMEQLAEERTTRPQPGGDFGGLGEGALL